MSKSIIELVDELPTDGLTVKVLKALNFVTPNAWEPVGGFNNLITAVTGKTREKGINKIRRRSEELYNDTNNGYQGAIKIYQTLDGTDKAIAAAAFADKIGDTFSFIPFLDKLTIQADKVQAVDFVLKLMGELIAYSKINQFSLNPQQFLGDLQKNYKNEALLRMGAIIALDGILPLGPDFLTKIDSVLNQQDAATAFKENPATGSIAESIPTDDKIGYVKQAFGNLQGWISSFQQSKGLNQNSIVDKLRGFTDIADDKLDYVAAFIDASTNYYEYTGILTVASNVISRAYFNQEEDDDE